MSLVERLLLRIKRALHLCVSCVFQLQLFDSFLLLLNILVEALQQIVFVLKLSLRFGDRRSMLVDGLIVRLLLRVGCGQFLVERRRLLLERPDSLLLLLAVGIVALQLFVFCLELLESVRERGAIFVKRLLLRVKCAFRLRTSCVFVLQLLDSLLLLLHIFVDTLQQIVLLLKLSLRIGERRLSGVESLLLRIDRVLARLSCSNVALELLDFLVFLLRVLV